MEKKRAVLDRNGRELLFSGILNGKTLKEFCDKNGMSYSATKGYRSGRLTIPLKVFEELIRYPNVNAEGINYRVIAANWWQSRAGKKGARGLLRKYNKEALNAWRRLGGQRSKLDNTKKIILPAIVDENVSEIAGVYLGDGTLTNYFVRISGDKRFDVPYFVYLSGLVERTFGLRPKLREEKSRNLLYLEICSKKLCDYFQNCLGFKAGDKIKKETIIPASIMSRKNLFFACLRGLVDTDGSVSKDGGVLSIRFSNHNTALVKQLKGSDFLSDIFTIRSNQFETGTRCRAKIRKYFSLVGSSNLRHIVRYCEHLNGNLLRKKEVLTYYPLYKETRLPFKIQRQLAQ